jgi:hypothetical protein
MTKTNAAKVKLAQDIEAYLCGEVPDPLDMQRAAKLENWVTAVRRQGIRSGSLRRRQPTSGDR